MWIHTNDLNLDVDCHQSLGQWVDLDKTWVDSACEATELGDQTNGTLLDRSVWIGTADTTWYSTHSTND
jgi:hypothetical protein